MSVQNKGSSSFSGSKRICADRATSCSSSTPCANSSVIFPPLFYFVGNFGRPGTGGNSHHDSWYRASPKAVLPKNNKHFPPKRYRHILWFREPNSDGGMANGQTRHVRVESLFSLIMYSVAPWALLGMFSVLNVEFPPWWTFPAMARETAMIRDTGNRGRRHTVPPYFKPESPPQFGIPGTAERGTTENRDTAYSTAYKLKFPPIIAEPP